MNFADDNDERRRRSQDVPAETDAAPTRSRSKKKQAESPELGNALRTVYQRTIDEDIPPEMLDLLGKLG